MLAKLNGLPILSGTLHEPVRGAWTARVEVDDDAAGGGFSGPVTLEVGDATFTGVAEGELADGRFVARIVGGKGGLKTDLAANYYHDARLRTVVDDILRSTGEALDESEPHTELDQAYVPRWARLKGDARLALSAVAKHLGGFWRVSRSGGVVLRVADPWTDLGTTVEVGRDDAAKTATLAPEDGPLARPGTVVNGRRVVDVTTHFDAQAMRQKVSHEDLSRSRSPGAAIMEAAARATRSERAYAQWYPARVVRQADDGSLELYPDDETLRGNGLTRVPLRHGLPGCSVELYENARVLLFFEGGLPTQPAAALFPGETRVKTVHLHADLIELGGGGAGFVALASKVDAQLKAISTTLGSVVSASFTKPYKPISVAASKVKAE
jgi:hypothetical protein